VVSPVEKLRSKLEKVRPAGDGWTARCPAHDDDAPSLSLSQGDDGRALLNCHAGCESEDVVAALGLDWSDLFPDGDGPKRPRGWTLEDYASYLGIPVGWLRTKFGVRTERKPGKSPVVAIPYRSSFGEGGTIRTRHRTRDRFWWGSDGDGVALYGLDRLADADPERGVLLVEGESDVHILAFHDLLAVGVPGASSWRSSWSRHLEGRDIYVWREPDQGGDTLVRDVAEDLPDARVIEPPDGIDDPRDLHRDDPGSVRRRLGELYREVRPIGEVVASLDADEPREHEREPDPEPEKEAADGSSQKDRLLALTSDLELFSSERDRAFARIRRDGHRELWPVQSSRFRAWLAHRFYAAYQQAPTSSVVADVLQVLEGRARFEGPTHELHNRFARHEGALWIDMADEAWRAIRVDADGWEVVTDPPPLFRRYAHQKPHPEPTETDAHRLPELLAPFINVAGETEAEREEARLLVLVWLVTALLPEIPRPPLVPHGPHGSAKTFTSRILLSLVDPSATPMPRFPRGDDEMAQTLDHHAALGFDNLSNLSRRDSDTLCRAVTGDGFTKRKLYSDDEDVLYCFRRVLVLNGINVPAQQPDLLDRCLLVELDHIDTDDRRAEEELWAAFRSVRPRAFGAMLDALAKAHAREPDVDLEVLPRMADWTRWGHAVADALGLGGENFVRAYAANREDQTLEALVSHPVGAAVKALMADRKEWTGTSSELLSELEQVAERESIDTDAKLWPGSASWVTRRVREVETNLRKAGIRFRRDRDDQRRLALRRHPDATDGIEKMPSGSEGRRDKGFDGKTPMTAFSGPSNSRASEGGEGAETAETAESPKTPEKPGMEDAVGGRPPTNPEMEDAVGGVEERVHVPDAPEVFGDEPAAPDDEVAL